MFAPSRRTFNPSSFLPSPCMAVAMTLDLAKAGILPAQSIETLIAVGAITSQTPFDADQVQPASLDLRLSDRAWRVRASFLPGQRLVADRIADVAMHTIDLSGGYVMNKQGTHLIADDRRTRIISALYRCL